MPLALIGWEGGRKRGRKAETASQETCLIAYVHVLVGCDEGREFRMTGRRYAQMLVHGLLLGARCAAHHGRPSAGIITAATALTSA